LRLLYDGVAYPSKTLARDSKKSGGPRPICTVARVVRQITHVGPGEAVEIRRPHGGLASPFAAGAPFETNARKNSNQCDALAQPR
jgi:hypothetical protein